MVEHLVWMENLRHSEGHWSWSQMFISAVGDSLHNKKRYWAHYASIMRTKSLMSSRKFDKYATFDVLSTIQAHSAKHNMTAIVLNVGWSNSVSETVKEYDHYYIKKIHQQPHDLPIWMLPSVLMRRRTRWPSSIPIMRQKEEAPRDEMINNWCLPQIKSVPINSSWWWHVDLGEVCVWMYGRSRTAEGVNDTRLEMFARSCHQTGIIRSHAVNSIPARHSELCRMGMDEENNIWQIIWTYLPLLRRHSSSWLNAAADRNVIGGANATTLVWFAPHYALCNCYQDSPCSRWDLVICLKLLCSLLHDSILLLSSFITQYYFFVRHMIAVLSMYKSWNVSGTYFPIIFFFVVVLGSYLSLYKVTDSTPLYLLMITSVHIQDIDSYRCWFNIGLTSSFLAQHCYVSGSMLVFAGMNITVICLVHDIHLITSIIFWLIIPHGLGKIL